jgi:hypothetical protein
MSDLSNIRVAVLVTDGFEEAKLKTSRSSQFVMLLGN